MRKGYSIGTYYLIDITIFSILLIVFEFLSHKLIEWVPIPYFGFYVSISLTISLIGIMRWNYKGLVLSVIHGLSLNLIQGSTDYKTYLIYIIGNLFIALNLLWFIKGFKTKLTKNYLFVVLYVFTGFISTIIGRALIATIISRNNFLDLLLGYSLLEVINIFISVFVILIANKQQGVFKDQLEYIKEIKEEEYSTKEDLDNGRL